MTATSEEATRYPFRAVEAKWQARWQREGLPRAAEDAPAFYVLEMFPYPSGHIHMGHVRNYTLGDVLARYKRAAGFDVLHPMGWDAFGLPAENAAIERGVHPGVWTRQNIDAMRTQLQSIGLSYDWEREFATCDPDYYRHEQRFFLDFLREGLAYRKESFVNWDPVDHTVLANEQVIDGRGWRSGAPVQRKKLSQWFLKISDFADDLLAGLATLDQWPDKVRTMQERWIGRSVGAHIDFALETPVAGLESITVFTTRPDTVFGMAFCAVSPHHPVIQALERQDRALAAFVADCDRTGTSEEAIETAEKKGYDTGLRVRHPFDPNRLHPVYAANFVLMEYGTGAVFGCPAHDARDFAFATKYALPILPVVAGGKTPLVEAYTGDGVLMHSEFLNGLPVAEAKDAAIAKLEALGQGRGSVTTRLRDWGVSRQRYWGCPIPIIHCPSCGVVPVPQADLPVTLPDDVTFDAPGNPLVRHPTWKHVACPACGGPAERETDTLDTFFESSWYFARFCSPHASEPFDAASVARFLPVGRYIGGVEHAVLHLLYARFFTRALKHCGYLNTKEPFNGLLTQGMVCHETYKDEDGKWLYPDEAEARRARGLPVTVGRSEKMSKSKRNTVDPHHIIETYGADTARLFMLSDSPPERDLEWTEAGIDGAWRYVNRLWRSLSSLASLMQSPPNAQAGDAETALLRLAHRTVAGVTQDIEQCHFNKAVARLRSLSNAMFDSAPSRALYEAAMLFVPMLQPFLPHLAEEVWQHWGRTEPLAARPWPQADAALCAEESVTIAVQVNGKLRATFACAPDLPASALEAQAMALKPVQDLVAGKTVRKVIVVPGKIVNVVAA